nr:Chain S, Ribosomal protein S15 [Oryctolagus cuniculus]3J0O_S Chain S, Ribosomal protein S15 [Oryctolagus cuniculus]3J0P_S Chain S, Ribosomal protein S15 [Oryctolagus cuniculus]3J0Q_S Chain S, Ribosomal protein S15 [Oryctolagus cuniculus]
FTFRGKGLEELTALASGSNSEKLISDELAALFDAKTRRRVKRGISEKYAKFVNKVRRSKEKCPAGEKPVPVKTHYRSMIVIPELVGGIVGVYNGKEFVNVEVKFDMIGKYLAEFAMTYKPTTHGK